MSDGIQAEDGSAGDADYGSIGLTYSRFRREDPNIAAAIFAAPGDARRILNVVAGVGSYEPIDRDVTPVEPSATTRAQRPPHLAVKTKEVSSIRKRLELGRRR